MNTKILILLSVVALAAADSREIFAYAAPRFSSEESFESYESDEVKYNFKWDVQHEDSGNNYGQEEARENADTQGVYYVSLPDGRLQTVNYNVQGRSGFVPEVNYDGQARYPDSHSSESFESFEYAPRYFDSNESK
ncbi:pro-resilin-like [Panulirus ornatus]|uniref:pro-resilin-like n=1 Tax=Panulirus ornatus TaxID=150431 RepID=UPI003A8B225B